MILYYQPRAHIDELFVNQCTVHRASGSSSDRWWLLWFHVLRDTDNQPEIFCIPINPSGTFVENGPGGKTWGVRARDAVRDLSVVGTRDWAVTPSVNVLDTRDAVAGSVPRPSLWHQEIEIRNVPIDEDWANGGAP